MTERLHFHFSLSWVGEGNGNPLQCSCLENPRDGGAWWAAIYGVAQSRTQLMWLSSSSMLLIAKCNSLLMLLNKCLFFFFKVLCKVSLLWRHFGKLLQQCEVRIPSGDVRFHLKFIYNLLWWRSYCLQNLGVVELTVTLLWPGVHR